MIRSLVGLTLLLVGGVVLLLGLGVVTWITAEDLGEASQDARQQHAAAEAEMRALADVLVDDFQQAAVGLSERSSRRVRHWLEAEPLEIYRAPEPPHAFDPEALRGGLAGEARSRSLAEQAHLDAVQGVMEDHATRMIERVASERRLRAYAQAERAAEARRNRLALRLGLLLAGMALLLALTLYGLVLRPVGRLRKAVRRIAGGDLQTPVDTQAWPTREMAGLAEDVDLMRERMRRATEGLEEEVRRKTDRLVQAEKMAGLGTLAGGVAHEFNNLLGGILGCLESARAGTDDADVQEDLDVAKRTAERATRLVDALLGVARPGTREFKPVRLRGVVEDVLSAAAATLRQRRIDLRQDLDADPVVDGDEGQLHQVALNLVTNALQAVDDGERITVLLGQEGGQAQLEVRDAGPGVDPETRSRIFEPFFTGRAEGTGLGLFVSYGIVERHGGRIEVLDAPEGGARFVVRLPLAS